MQTKEEKEELFSPSKKKQKGKKRCMYAKLCLQEKYMKVWL